nr:MAG TPA: hypothetical protein [Caudoviricetes sp.]
MDLQSFKKIFENFFTQKKVKKMDFDFSRWRCGVL